MKEDEASSTAKVIAGATILLSRTTDRRYLVADGAAALCEVFLSTSWRDRLLARTARWSCTRWFLWYLEGATLRGIIPHYWLRKRVIEKICRESIAEGFRKIVVLGAGFDTLLLRLGREFPELELVEYDHPATQRVKDRALDRGQIERPPKLVLRRLDLNTDVGVLVSDLQQPVPTIVVCEGLLMYFDHTRVKTIVDALPKHARLVATYMENIDNAPIGFRPRSRVIDYWLRLREEPFRWSLAPSQVGPFFADHGMALKHHYRAADFTDICGLSHLSFHHNIEGENIVCCDGLGL